MVKDIRLGIIGVGNCASNLVQGLFYYRNKPLPVHNELGGYKITHIKPVVAIDVDANKVGKDLSEAIFSKPNNTDRIAHVPKMGVRVEKGPVLDGVGEYMSHMVTVDKRAPVNIAKLFMENKVDVVLNFLPVGSSEAARFYANEAIKASCGFVNAIPEFIASEKSWEKRFAEAGLPIIGDDTKAQVGATIVHRVLSNLCADRGAKIDRMYQINIGGNSDFYNMLERSRLKSKKISKTEAVQSQLASRLVDENIHIGPSDYVPWLNSRKLCFIRIEGRLFSGIPFTIDVKLDVEDKANSSGVVVDAIRCCKIAMDRGIGGALISPSAYFCKHPPHQYPDSVAKQMLEEFISGQRER